MARQDLAFEHRVLQPLKKLKNRPRRWLLAVSGGADSMALAEFCRRWSRGLKIEFAVAHVHHGSLGAASSVKFRARAQRHVRSWCASHGIEFLTNVPEKIELRSESELRDYRRAWLEKWRSEHGFDTVAFAHHSDDLLETRLLRLIRGTGAFGLVSMRAKSKRSLRPLLSVSREEILTYLRVTGVKWVEDPSNETAGPLRNWLRREWLPLLEKRQPGALKSLSRSLARTAAANGRRTRVDMDAGVRRDSINEASYREREELVAAYLRGLGLNNYAQAHVREILKRIDTRRKNLTFEMLGVVFEVTPDFLRASRV